MPSCGKTQTPRYSESGDFCEPVARVAQPLDAHDAGDGGRVPPRMSLGSGRITQNQGPSRAIRQAQSPRDTTVTARHDARVGLTRAENRVARGAGGGEHRGRHRAVPSSSRLRESHP